MSLVDYSDKKKITVININKAISPHFLTKVRDTELYNQIRDPLEL